MNYWYVSVWLRQKEDAIQFNIAILRHVNRPNKNHKGLIHYIYTYYAAVHLSKSGRSLRGVLANVLDYDTVVREFEFQSRYYVHIRTNILGKGMNSLPPSFELNDTSPVLRKGWLWH